MIRHFFDPAHRFAKFRLTIVGIIGGFFLLILAFLLYVWYDMPSFESLDHEDSSLASVVYSADGATMGSFFKEYDRQKVDLSQIPSFMQHALISTEDVRFYEHPGIDLKSMFGVFTSILSGNPRGGSTLTQQLARNFYEKEVGKSRTIVRKVKEAIVALFMERRYTKHEILRHYFNTVPFGGTSFGVQAGAQMYFDKDVKDLTPEECALLIGMLKGPSVYNPFRHEARAKARRNTVIDQMLKNSEVTGLTSREAFKLKSIEINVKRGGRKQKHNEGIATYFREYLRGHLIDVLIKNNIKITKDGKQLTPSIYTDGLKIYTTIDSRIQAYAEAAVKEHLTDHQKLFEANLRGRDPFRADPQIYQLCVQSSARYKAAKEEGLSEDEIKKEFAKPIKMRLFAYNKRGSIDTIMSPRDSIRYYSKFLEAGAMMMDPNNGNIKAWVGGLDMEYFQYDHVYTSRRQVGSTFKPIVYSAAFDNGRSPCEIYSNEPITLPTYDPRSGRETLWTPKNVEGSTGGSFALRDALRLSMNIITVRLCKDINPKTVSQYAEKFGLKGIPPYYATALGTHEQSVYEMARAYSVFANGGMIYEPICIDRILTKDGRLLYKSPKKPEQAIDPVVAHTMAQILRTVVLSGTAGHLHYQYKVPSSIFVAGKTGTTNDYSDGWFCGFTPLIAGSVWVGCSQPKIHFENSVYGQGGFMALPIFGKILNKVYADKELNFNQMAQLKQPLGNPNNKPTLDCKDFDPNAKIEEIEPDAPQTPQHKTSDFF